MAVAVVAWISFDGRSAALGRALGADVHFVAIGRRGDVARAPLRYLRQAVRTARLVARLRADRLIVQNPPIVAALVVWLSQRFVGGDLVIDSHSGAFIDRRWRRFLFLHRWLSRRALVTIVHNDEQAEVVDGWDAPWLLLGYVPIDIPDADKPRRSSNPLVIAVCSGAGDEPLDAIVAAARSLPDVGFRVTGRRERIEQHLTEPLPPNVEIPGFLPFDEYYQWLRSADLVLSLTTRSGTLVNGGFEAIAARRPLVTSDTGVLQGYFHRGAVFTGSEPAEIVAAVRSALADAEELEQAMAQLADEYLVAWDTAQAVLGGGATDGRS